MKSIQTTGGPFILLGRKLLSSWNGIEGDYERACSIQDWAGAIPVNGKEALVLRGDELEAFRIMKQDICAIARFVYVSSVSSIPKYLERVTHNLFPEDARSIDFGDSNAVLLDSATHGLQLSEEDAFGFPLPANRCRVKTTVWDADKETQLVLHGFYPD